MSRSNGRCRWYSRPSRSTWGAYDLTDETFLARLGLTVKDLTADRWWEARASGRESLTQAVGRALHAVGAQAVLVPSAQSSSHGHNALVLPEHIAPPSSVRVLRAARKH